MPPPPPPRGPPTPCGAVCSRGNGSEPLGWRAVRAAGDPGRSQPGASAGSPQAIPEPLGCWALSVLQANVPEGQQPPVCHQRDATKQGQLLLFGLEGRGREAGGGLLESWRPVPGYHPSQAGSAPPPSGEQAGWLTAPAGAALLRPKRPTGLTLRPAYQAGSMWGAAKEGQGLVRGVPGACPLSLRRVAGEVTSGQRAASGNGNSS